MSRFTKILNSIIGLCLMAFAALAFYLFFYQDVIPWLGPYVIIWGFAVGCTLTMATGIVILGIGLAAAACHIFTTTAKAAAWP